jgi:hypothetical protein
MDVINFTAWVAQQKVLEASDIVPADDMLVIGKKVNRLRDGSEYQEFAMSIGEFLAQLGTSYKYEIGQYVHSEGGVIFHRWLSKTAGTEPTSGRVQNYLVMSVNFLGNAPWGLFEINVVSCESTWDGLSNTNAITAAGGLPTDAAGLCVAYSALGKSDWYLPSIDELNKIWINRRDIAQGLIVGSGIKIENIKCWSSTEVDKGSAYVFGFTGAAIGGTNKLDTGVNVLPVRTFSI